MQAKVPQPDNGGYRHAAIISPDFCSDHRHEGHEKDDAKQQNPARAHAELELLQTEANDACHIQESVQRAEYG